MWYFYLYEYHVVQSVKCQKYVSISVPLTEIRFVASFRHEKIPRNFGEIPDE